MKHPVSTLDESCGGPALGGVVERDVVRTAVLPAAPEHATPCAGQDAEGVGMMAAPPPGGGVDRRCPRRGMARVVGEAGERLPEAFVARPANGDTAVFAGFANDRRDAALGGQLLVGGKAAAIIPELGQALSGVHGAATREGLQKGAGGGLRQGGG